MRKPAPFPGLVFSYPERMSTMSMVTSVRIGMTSTYLFRKCDIYYFRIVIPANMSKVFGGTEMNCSLQAEDLLQLF